MSEWASFLKEEAIVRDVIAVRRVYLRIAGDLAAGVMLSQIIYWFLDDQNGNKKTTIHFEGEDWIAKRLEDWETECFLSPDQARRCLGLLRDRGLIVTANRKFNGSPTTHIRIVKDALIRAYREGGTPNGSGEKPKTDMGENPSGSGEKPKTINKEETTAKTTAEISSPPAAQTGGVSQNADAVDPRWNEIREDLKAYWEFKNPAVPMPWSGAIDGLALKRFLKANPNLDRPMWQLCLNHRARSDVPHAEEIHRWIRTLLRFVEGPRDRFDQLKPKGRSRKHDEQSELHSANRSVGDRWLERTGKAPPAEGISGGVRGVLEPPRE